MFDLIDPYKLILDLIIDAYTLHQRYYEPRQKFYECNFIDEKINGISQQYYDTGVLQITNNYINGLKHGECQQYYESGQLKKELHFVLGNLKN
jgi:antitoxin component YwqK of YwqJK toxin-antitoxin module